MSEEKLPLARLLDACHVLDVGLLWDPEKFPEGPTEVQRPILIASLAVALETMRSQVMRPSNIAAMRTIHGDAFGNDPISILKHTLCALSYHAQILKNLEDSDAAHAAYGLLVTAVSILVSAVEEVPYANVPFASYAIGRTGEQCPGCGQVH